MTTTTQSQSNIAKAHEACLQWDKVTMDDLPDVISAISGILYASCLTRVGRDTDAIHVFNRCIALQEHLEPSTLEDVIIGRASALQRLMRYKEASDQFIRSRSERATLGAVTCYLRLGELEMAVDLLQQRAEDSVETRAMSTILNFVLQADDTLDEKNALDTLQEAAPRSPLYHWIMGVAKGNLDKSHSFDFLQWATINQTPLDDPLLIVLDDKINLHQLLNPTQANYWPMGFVIPHELHMLRQEARNDRTAKSWILKSPTGYGSHGNRILSKHQILTLEMDEFRFLCQHLVEPALLLDGRKFSMRVYIYYFVDGSVYLSKHGLVKLASQLYSVGGTDDRMHMTNSGREENMVQHDLDYLSNKFLDMGLSYSTFWSQIECAIKSTMKCYQDYCDDQEENVSYRTQLAQLGIPKIMGLDFIVTETLQPMLLEVNRFPGLEPRGDGDEFVKHTVVREAWICASERLGIGHRGTNEKIAYTKVLNGR